MTKQDLSLSALFRDLSANVHHRKLGGDRLRFENDGKLYGVTAHGAHVLGERILTQDDLKVGPRPTVEIRTIDGALKTIDGTASFLPETKELLERVLPKPSQEQYNGWPKELPHVLSRLIEGAQNYRDHGLIAGLSVYKMNSGDFLLRYQARNEAGTRERVCLYDERGQSLQSNAIPCIGSKKGIPLGL